MEQPRDKTSQEQARESLIEISYTSPEEEEYIITSSDVKPVISSTTTNGATKGGSTDDADKLRAELISISYDESPSPDVDVAVSPTLPNGFCRG
ncbi:PREDICTED: uncharacterized protein LOC104741845 [Camelina sativa]|uniref:Uncharacterized protein LOC104741845 n=1 Tax=Camelina sativa TaxID=90675 RepID=A0ABM1QVQ2_CAMSA|nr:PREDICTED: uncharacterized protein LOC104741845 [Camelina sativa]